MFPGLSQVLGSLTLGGYDTSKFIPNDFSVPFSPDVDKDLTVQIDSISTDNGVMLLPSPVMAFLDSSIPYIYLPASTCSLFESAFGIVWNDLLQLYFVNATQHVTLQTQNPNVTFTISSNYTVSKVNITLPYAAFDLAVSDPLVNGTARYFPLKRANDSSQYTLGRAFFQEAYVIADYERKNFSVSQCKWVLASPNIVPILPPSNSTLGPPSQSKPLPVGAIAGSVAGIVSILLLANLVFFLWWRPKQRKRKAAKLAAHPTSPQTLEYIKPELDSTPLTPLSGTTIFEAEGGWKIDQIAEIGTHNEIYEMPAREEVAAEMTGQTKPSELSSRERRWSWVRGDSRASRFKFGRSRAGSPTNPSSPDANTATMSSLSSGMGSLGDQIVSPQDVSPERTGQGMNQPSSR